MLNSSITRLMPSSNAVLISSDIGWEISVDDGDDIDNASFCIYYLAKEIMHSSLSYRGYTLLVIKSNT